jgi:anti-sigma regulatory factor (Ser/Thr protein kinase)
LIESTRDLEAGIAALRHAIADDAFFCAARPAAYLQSRLLPESARDDVAIMTVKMLNDDLRARGLRRWNFTKVDSAGVQRLRREFRDALQARGANVERVEYAELVLGELVGNVARHAPGPLEVILDFSNRRPVLHVIDEGPGFERAPMLPLDLMSESGRGLYIVSQATMEFSVMRRRPHGSHARAVLL